MKPTPLHRTSWLRRLVELRPRNPERQKRREKAGKVYGPYHRAMSGLPCILASHPLHECRGPVCGHHLRRVSAGGEDMGNEVPVCIRAHVECHTEGDRRVEERYGVDFHALAERLAEELR
jgi:hypothetical protein